MLLQVLSKAVLSVFESTALDSVIIKQFLTGQVRNCFIMERILFGRWNKRHAPYVCKLFGIASL